MFRLRTLCHTNSDSTEVEIVESEIDDITRMMRRDLSPTSSTSCSSFAEMEKNYQVLCSKNSNLPTMDIEVIPPHLRKVKFSNVEIRHYTTVLSSNPACRRGPPVELGWEYNQATELEGIQAGSSVKLRDGNLPIEAYESLRPSAHRERPRGRSLAAMYLSPLARATRLKKLQYKDDEMDKAMEEAAKIRKGREISNLLQNPMSSWKTRRSHRIRRMKRTVHQLKVARAEKLGYFAETESEDSDASSTDADTLRATE